VGTWGRVKGGKGSNKGKGGKGEGLEVGGTG
jgi:hypothetical protein